MKPVTAASVRANSLHFPSGGQMGIFFGQAGIYGNLVDTIQIEVEASFFVNQETASGVQHGRGADVYTATEHVTDQRDTQQSQKGATNC